MLRRPRGNGGSMDSRGRSAYVDGILVPLCTQSKVLIHPSVYLIIYHHYHSSWFLVPHFDLLQLRMISK